MLTPKQDKFVQAYLETGNATEAYRQAYDTSRMKEATINKRASELLAEGEITGRISNYRAEAAAKAVMTLECHLADLKILRNAAAKAGKWSAAVSAEIARGKASGVAIDRTEAEVLVRTNPAAMTDDALLAIATGKK